MRILSIKSGNDEFDFKCGGFFTAGRGLTTDWSLVTATAPEAPMRMKKVSLDLVLMRNKVQSLTHTEPRGFHSLQLLFGETLRMWTFQ